MGTENKPLDSLPRYKCHKEVWAFRIASITPLDGGGALLDSGIFGCPEMRVGSDYIDRCQPHVGGYYELYADGYESFWPADAFESGYTLISGPCKCGNGYDADGDGDCPSCANAIGVTGGNRAPVDGGYLDALSVGDVVRRIDNLARDIERSTMMSEQGVARLESAARVLKLEADILISARSAGMARRDLK